MAESKEWYIIDDVDVLDTPVLTVYPQRVKTNISALIDMIDDVARLRPHAKTYKNQEVTRLMLEAGIKKFKCATIAEAEMLAMCQAPDVLLAYQPVGPKLTRFIRLINKYPETLFSCLADNLREAIEISEAALSANIIIPVYIDLNIGQNRTGIVPEEARHLYTECAILTGLTLMGLHAYDGHIHDADFVTRESKCNDAFERVTLLITQLNQAGFTPLIIAGGSPTFPVHAKRAEIQCSPGTFVYWDKGYQTILAEQPFIPAALIISRVISLPDEKKICLDVGHKSVSAENEISNRIFFLNAPDLKMISQSEEHLVADAGYYHSYKVGDILYGLPYHICPTVALYERAITIKSNKITGEWKNIARDRKISV